jgi:hypothetical protein
VIAGLLYGIAMYVVMNFIVLPLSAYPGKFSFNPEVVVANLLAQMFLFGLPIALVTRRATLSQ